MPTCALCLTAVERLIESHIIPEFLYQDIYDDKHRFMVFSERHERPVLPPQQKGIRQQLLCGSCENHFSRWERYASLVLFGGVELGYRDQPDHAEYSGLDYQPFKLFQMSMLWRMSLANGKGFNGVVLGAKHEERIRAMLLASDPGEPYEYGCRICSSPPEHSVMRHLIVAPTATTRKVQGHQCYVTVLGGLLWFYLVSSHMASFPDRGAFIECSGILRVWKPDDKIRALIRDMIQPVKTSNAYFLANEQGT